MKFSSKTTATAIALFLMLTTTALIASMPTVKAAEYDTYLYGAVTPNPVGVGQQVQCTFMMVNLPPPQYPVESPRYGYWDGLMLTITKPDGKTETIGPVSSKEAGSGYTYYTPTMIGNYSTYWTFPGQNITIGPSKGDYYKPCTSPKTNFTVQQEPILPWPAAALPRGYWEAPIYGENREWSVLAGNWLYGQDYLPGYGGFSLYGTAPNSAHILWTKQEMFGGILQANFSVPYEAYTGRRPSTKLDPPIIIAGRLYYNNPPFLGTFSVPLYTGFKCVDLYTGETIWQNNGDGLRIDCGQIVYHYATSQEGIFPYLWSTYSSVWQMFDAWTGRWILNITGVGSGTNTVGPKGEILRYQLSGANNWLTMWNSSKLLLTRMRAIGVAVDWDPVPGVYNYSDGMQWNKTLTDVAGSPSINTIAPDLNLIIATNTFPATTQYPNGISQELAYSLKPGEEGQILWIANRTGLDAPLGIGLYGGGVYYKWDERFLQYYSYDAANGNYLGLTVPNDNAFSIYSSPSTNSVVGYGTHFNTGYDGIVRAWNKTGALLWEWFAGSSGFETPEGSWPLHGSYTGPKLADGKVFVINSEHTPAANPWRGGKVYAINATTGVGIWNISGTQAEAASMAIGFGYLVYLNGYDGKIYCFGKGPSATTVTAPQTAITLGQSIMITGTVTDQSPRAKGAAAVADASQSDWMGYLYQQKPIPTNATGVEVTLDVLDANGNYRNIGTVTTDISGTFGYMWAPDIPGQYTIIATFAGSESYGSSYAQTYIGVSEAPPATTPPQYPVPADYTLTIIGTGIGAGIAILIAIAVAVLMLRKQQ